MERITRNGVRGHVEPVFVQLSEDVVDLPLEVPLGPRADRETGV